MICAMANLLNIYLASEGEEDDLYSGYEYNDPMIDVSVYIGDIMRALIESRLCSYLLCDHLVTLTTHTHTHTHTHTGAGRRSRVPAYRQNTIRKSSSPASMCTSHLLYIECIILTSATYLFKLPCTLDGWWHSTS